MSGGSGGFLGAVGLLVFVASVVASLLLTPTLFAMTWSYVGPRLSAYGLSFLSWAPYLWVGLIAFGIYGGCRAILFFITQSIGLLTAMRIVGKRWK